MPRPKSLMQVGLEKVLNNPSCSPLTQPQVFKQLMTTANQPISASLKHIGKTSKMTKPTDAERGKARLEKLEESAEK